jgi:hypothetical protein
MRRPQKNHKEQSDGQKVAPITTQNKKTMKTTRSKVMAKRTTTTTIQDEKTIKTKIPKPLNPNYVTEIKN